MLSRLSSLLGSVLLAALGWWLWTGPVQDWRTVSVEEQLQINKETMTRCLYGKEYVASATGAGAIDPEAACARKYQLYRHDGEWYGYDMVRRESKASAAASSS